MDGELRLGTSNKALLAAISEDRALGSSMLFSQRHPDPTPAFHVQIMDAQRAVEALILIEAFRGAGKTTVGEESDLMEGCFGNFSYLLLIGETYEKACQSLEAMAHEGRTNVKIHALFGNPFTKAIENKLLFKSGAMIQAVGWEQEFRGFKHHERRPDRARLDDIENLERVRDSKAVDATMRKLYRELLPAMDNKRRKVRVQQTPMAVDCMVTRIRASAGWVVISIPIANGDLDDARTVSAWPQKYSMDWIRAERDLWAADGQLAEFMQEYMLRVDSIETKPFDTEDLRFAALAPGASWLPRYAIFDPARTTVAKTSDRTGKVVVSRMGSKIIVHESRAALQKPDETRTDIFDTQARHECAAIGVEKNSLDEYLMQPIRYEMLKRGVVLPLKALSAPQDRDKDAFIMGLQAFVKANDVVLVGDPQDHKDLVAQMKNFPGGKKDVLNALAYAPRMFAGEPVYPDFSADNVSQAPEPTRAQTLYTAWNSDGVDTVCVAMLRSGRHVFVARDWGATGPVLDAARSLAAELRGAFPNHPFSSWVSAELHDQWQRVGLVPAMREVRLSPMRGEHVAVARGALADKARMVVRGRRLFSVDPQARLTLNAFAGGYKFPIGRGGSAAREPEAGLSRLTAEAIETAIAVLDKGVDEGLPKGAHRAENARGTSYMTSLPAGR